jgi:hypothetical protein
MLNLVLKNVAATCMETSDLLQYICAEILSFQLIFSRTYASRPFSIQAI